MPIIMRRKKMEKRFGSFTLFFIVFTLFFAKCSLINRNNKLEITYTLMEGEDFVPSRQTAIWLEKPDGTFVKTLFVSEYMAFGGYLVPGICPDWTSKSGWKKVDQKEFDAVTGATPRAGKVKMKLVLPSGQIPAGEYVLLMEVHLVEEYNVLCKSRIDLAGGKCRKAMDIKYIPEKYPKLRNKYLTDVQIVCK